MATGRRAQTRRLSAMVAFCGMAAALSVVVMLTGGVLAVATYAAPLLAAVLLLPLRVEFGPKAAWGTWGITAALSLLLGLDREAACFYLFVGWWPIVKWTVELRIKGRLPRTALKLLVFSAAVAAMYALLLLVVPVEALLAELGEMGAWMRAGFFGGLVLCLMLYDRLLTPLSMLYAVRIQPRLRSLLR